MTASQAQQPLFPPFDTCPSCEAVGLVPIRTRRGLAFQCQACSRCWHVDMGWATQVDPVTGQLLAHPVSGRPR